MTIDMICLELAKLGISTREHPLVVGAYVCEVRVTCGDNDYVVPVAITKESVEKMPSKRIIETVRARLYGNLVKMIEGSFQYEEARNDQIDEIRKMVTPIKITPIKHET